MSTSNDLDEATALLLDFAQTMHRVQMPADTIDDYLRPIAERFGISADVLMLQSFLAGEARDQTRKRIELRRMQFEAHWRLARVRELAALAIACARGEYTAAEARRRLAAITAEKWHAPRVAVVAAYGVYGAAVTARIGGRGLEMLVAFLVGVLCGLVHYVAIGRRVVDLQKTFFAALAASVLVLVCTRLLPVFDASRALFGGITLLVPAASLTIATHELANDALESGTARLAYGLLRFMMLGAGVAAAIKLWLLVAPIPLSRSIAPLPVPAVLAILVAGGLALVLCLQSRWADAPWILLGVLGAYVTQAATQLAFGEDGAPFASAFVLGVVGYLHARFVRGGIPATVIVPGLLQLAPGFLGTQAVFALLRDEAGGHDTFFHVFLVAIQLGSGLVLASVLFARRRR
jgi:uncharacterized membrane protein YjjP (DUF1212 family)